MKVYFTHLLKLSFKMATVASLTFVFLTILTNYFGPIKFSLNTKNLDQRNLFTVEGEGKVSVKPDVAFVSLGVIVQNRSVTAGQKQANEVINKLVDSLKALGVAERDVKTISYNIYPNYSYDGGRPTLNGYTVNVELSVKVRDLEKINQVIDNATVQGINQVGGVSFDVENKEKFLDEARSQAVKEVKEKAQRLAALAGLRLGRIVNVREAPTELPRPIPLMLTAEKGIGAVAPETQVQPGSTEIKVTLSLDYETL